MSTDRHLPRWRAPMDAADARRYMTRAVKTAEKIMYESYERGDVDTTLAACTRITQATQVLLKCIDADELTARIERLETRNDIIERAIQNGHHHVN